MVFAAPHTNDPDASGQRATDAATRAIPSARAERVRSIDVLRGVAVLGILLMNITGFALGRGVTDDPTIAGGSTGADLWVWAINAVLFEGKMRTIFSMLFGASVLLLVGRIEARRGGEHVADIHLRRNLWLVLFGIVHAYLLLWPGEILYMYGIIGLPLFAFRRLRPRSLLLAGALVLAVLVPKNIISDTELRTAVDGVAAVERATAAGQPLTEEQKKSIDDWRAQVARARPDAGAREKEIRERRDGYLANVRSLAAASARMESTVFYNFLFFDVAGTMLIGMGLFKLGVFSAARSYRFYAAIVIAGYVIGIPLGTWVVHDWVRQGFAPAARVWVFYDVTRISVALAHVGLVMLVCKTGALPWLTRPLGAVGQMALTNYIVQAIICGFVFYGYGYGYGYGFGLFGQLARHQIYYVVGAIWIVQLVASPIWLSHFRFGPLEWLWRSLTYRRMQSMRASPTAPAGLVAT